MKRNIMFLISMLLTSVGNILADDLSVADIKISAGEEKQIAINLTNPDRQYVACQFDLVLPEGISISKDERGRFMAIMNEDRISDHESRPQVAAVASDFRFISYSGSNSAYVGTDGPLVYITLKADDSFTYGNFNASVVKAKFTEADGTKHTFSDISFAINNPKPASAVTITVKDATRRYGDANPEFEYTVDGGELQGSPLLSCDANATSNVGEYVISVSKGSVTNENVTFVNGKLLIEKAPLTIKAEDKQMTQGEAIPTFTASYKGFKNGESESVLTQKPEFLCSATSDSEAGTYVITPFNAAAQNYVISYEKGTLTIAPKPGPVENDRLSVADVEIEAGSTKEVAVLLNNPNRQYVAFQFDIILPDGVSVSEAKLNERRTVDHTKNLAKLASGAYRLLAYSASNAAFSSTEGEILKLILTAEENVKSGTYSAFITNQKFTVADGTKYTFGDLEFSIIVKSIKPEPEEVRITMNSEWQLFSCDKDLNFDEIGLKAFIASGVDAKDGKVTMTKIEEVPAGTGVLLVGQAGMAYSVPVKDAAYVYSNLLKGVLTESMIATGYLLDGKLFKSINGNATVAAGSAYLDVNISAQEMEVVLIEGVHSEISSHWQPSGKNGPWFTLQGTRLNEAPTQRGIYINKGRKVCVK